MGGIEFETEFVYDLELPVDFVPIPHDGEVSTYYLWGMDKVSMPSPEVSVFERNGR